MLCRAVGWSGVLLQELLHLLMGCPQQAMIMAVDRHPHH